MQNVEGDSQDIAVVAVHEVFEGFAVAALCAFDQGAFFRRAKSAPCSSLWQRNPPRDLRKPFPDQAIVISSAAMRWPLELLGPYIPNWTRRGNEKVSNQLSVVSRVGRML